MTKAELIDLIAESHSVNKKTSSDILETLFSTMQTTIQSSEKFTYPGFGTFTVRHRKARKGTDPRTKATIDIPASKTVGFKPAKAFKEVL
jgi:DNA-binding protein HU-beta